MGIHTDYLMLLSVGGMLAILICIIILQGINHYRERKELQQTIRDLQDRFMAKDYNDYSVGQHIMNKRPMTDVEVVESVYGITPEDKEQADRLPVG